MRVQWHSACNSDIGTVVFKLRRDTSPEDHRVRVWIALSTYVNSKLIQWARHTHRCNTVGEVELAWVDCDVVVTLLQMPLHHLWHVDTHGRMVQRRTLEVDVVIVRSCGSCRE